MSCLIPVIIIEQQNISYILSFKQKDLKITSTLKIILSFRK